MALPKSAILISYLSLINILLGLISQCIIPYLCKYFNPYNIYYVTFLTLLIILYVLLMDMLYFLLYIINYINNIQVLYMQIHYLKNLLYI